MKKYYNIFVICFSLFIISCDQIPGYEAAAPYPPSSTIKDVIWDFSTLTRAAPGSDLWPTTWASDNTIYTSWGDGGGFSGTNSKGRVSLGFAKIEGPAENPNMYNIWGGENTKSIATFNGKCTGLLSVDGIIYAWINLQNNEWPDVDITLAWSSDLGSTWNKVDWSFSAGKGKFKPSTFLNYGKDYNGARDQFIYFYGGKQEDNNNSYLGRVGKYSIKDYKQYEYFYGIDSDRNPIWTKNIKQIKPVFSDTNRCSSGSVIYNQGLKRYILTNHRGEINKLGIFDAPEPWGPWTTIAYYDNWGKFKGSGLIYSIPTKWISDDGKTMWMIFSGIKKLDSFNLVKATLKLKTAP